jgi:isopenicillin N synthase-like dioxygenase
MTYVQAKKTDFRSIPVIDISDLHAGNFTAEIGKALHETSQQLGFIYVKGHGIPANVIDKARDSAYRFFRSDTKQKSTIAISPKHRGWLSPGDAKMQDHLKPDLKESFVWGYQDSNGIAPSDHPLRGPNQWPSFIPELEECAMDYFRRAQHVAHLLMRGFAAGLNLDDDLFLKTSNRPLSRASFVYYPPQPESLGEDRFGVGPHTDFGVLTVLCQDSVGGLQVQTSDGEWIEAPPIDGTLVVNVGDLLSRWTDGAYKSTPHRVINKSGRERLSLVLAFDPNPETLIDARDIYGPDYKAKEKAITCGDYLDWRFSKSFSYRNK